MTSARRRRRSRRAPTRVRFHEKFPSHFSRRLSARSTCPPYVAAASTACGLFIAALFAHRETLARHGRRRRRVAVRASPRRGRRTRARGPGEPTARRRSSPPPPPARRRPARGAASACTTTAPRTSLSSRDRRWYAAGRAGASRSFAVQRTRRARIAACRPRAPPARRRDVDPKLKGAKVWAFPGSAGVPRRGRPVAAAAPFRSTALVYAPSRFSPRSRRTGVARRRRRDGGRPSEQQTVENWSATKRVPCRVRAAVVDAGSARRRGVGARPSQAPPAGRQRLSPKAPRSMRTA